MSLHSKKCSLSVAIIHHPQEPNLQFSSMINNSCKVGCYLHLIPQDNQCLPYSYNITHRNLKVDNNTGKGLNIAFSPAATLGALLTGVAFWNGVRCWHCNLWASWDTLLNNAVFSNSARVLAPFTTTFALLSSSCNLNNILVAVDLHIILFHCISLLLSIYTLFIVTIRRETLQTPLRVGTSDIMM